MSPTMSQSKEITYRIHKAVFLLDKLSDQILQDRLGFGFSQFLVLMALADEARVPQKQVAKALDQTQAAVSRQVDILVGLGLVSRGTNPDNRREYALSLTKAGQARFKDGLAAIDQRFDGLFGVWTRQEKAVMLSALQKLTDEIHSKGSEKICGRAG